LEAWYPDIFQPQAGNGFTSAICALKNAVTSTKKTDHAAELRPARCDLARRHEAGHCHVAGAGSCRTLLVVAPASRQRPRRARIFCTTASVSRGLRELSGISLLAAGGCVLALSQGDLLFAAIFGAACAVATIEAIRLSR